MRKVLNRNLIDSVEKLFFTLFLLSLAIPLSKSMFTFGWTRIYFFDFFLFPVLALWCLRMNLGSFPLKHEFNKLDIYLFLLLTWLFACNSFGLNPNSSLEAWALLLRCFLIYLYSSRNIGNIFPEKNVMAIFCLLLLIEAGLGLFQHFGKTNFGQINSYFGANKLISEFGDHKKLRVPGTFIQPNILAGWMLYLILMIISWGMATQKQSKRIFLFLISSLGFCCMLVTFSRVKIVAFFLGIFLLAWWNRNEITKQKNLKIKIFLVLGMVSLIFIGIATDKTETTKRFQKKFNEVITFKSISLERKSLQRKIAFEEMVKNPVTGIGQKNFGLVIDKERYPFKYRNKALACHNIPLRIGAESGFPGFVIFCAMFLHLCFLCLQRLKNPPRKESEAIMGGALICSLVMVFDMQFNTVFFHPSFMPLFFVILSLTSLGYKELKTV